MSLSKTGTGCSACFKALSVPSRLKIYTYLAKNKSATVSEIVEVVGLKQPTVSYHLKEMENLGMIDHVKKGKEVFYSLDAKCHSLGKDCFLNEVNLNA